MKLIIILLSIITFLFKESFTPSSNTSTNQHCSHSDSLKLKILNSEKVFQPRGIKEIQLKICSFYSWGLGDQIETLNYRIKDSRLVSNKIKVNKIKGNKDSIYYNRIENFIDTSKLAQIINDINFKKLSFIFLIDDSINKISLERQEDYGLEAIIPSCVDCTQYYIELTIFSKTNSIKYSYQFDESFSLMNSFLQNKPVDVQSVVNWLYLYKLLNLTIKDHEIVKKVFNNSNLEKIIQWKKNTNA